MSYKGEMIAYRWLHGLYLLYAPNPVTYEKLNPFYA